MYDFGVFDARMGRLTRPQGPIGEHNPAIGQSCLNKLARPITTSLKGNPMNNTKKRAKRVSVICNMLIVSNLSFIGCRKTRSSGFPAGSGGFQTRSSGFRMRLGGFPAGSNRLRCTLLGGLDAIRGHDANCQAAARVVYRSSVVAETCGRGYWMGPRRRLVWPWRRLVSSRRWREPAVGAVLRRRNLEVVILVIKNDRHPVMERGDHVVGRRCDDGAGFDQPRRANDPRQLRRRPPVGEIPGRREDRVAVPTFVSTILPLLIGLP